MRKTTLEVFLEDPCFRSQFIRWLQLFTHSGKLLLLLLLKDLLLSQGLDAQIHHLVRLKHRVDEALRLRPGLFDFFLELTIS